MQRRSMRALHKIRLTSVTTESAGVSPAGVSLFRSFAYRFELGDTTFYFCYWDVVRYHPLETLYKSQVQRLLIWRVSM